MCLMSGGRQGTQANRGRDILGWHEVINQPRTGLPVPLSQALWLRHLQCFLIPGAMYDVNRGVHAQDCGDAGKARCIGISSHSRTMKDADLAII